MGKIDFKKSKLVLIIGLIVIVIVAVAACVGYTRYQSYKAKIQACQTTEVAKTEQCTNDSLFVGCSSFF